MSKKYFLMCPIKRCMFGIITNKKVSNLFQDLTEGLAGFLTSVDAIEQKTGLDFFSEMTADWQELWEGRVSGMW